MQWKPGRGFDMTMALAIEPPGTGLGNAAGGKVRNTSQAVLREAISAPPFGAGDPAVEIDGPQPFMPVVQPRNPRSHYRWVDAVVTFAVMVLFTAALACMVGELHGAPSAPVTKTATTNVAPSAMPHLAANRPATGRAGPTSV
jgi:hypothetical protein